VGRVLAGQRDRAVRDVGAHASISVARTLLLELIRSVTSPSGQLLVDYQVIG
jgi:hypothetical protein